VRGSEANRYIDTNGKVLGDILTTLSGVILLGGKGGFYATG